MKRLALLTIAVLDCIAVCAQTDSEPYTLVAERKNILNVLLNAPSDSQPWVRSLGIYPYWVSRFLMTDCRPPCIMISSPVSGHGEAASGHNRSN